MIISKKRQYQDTASIRESGRCRPRFCDEPVDQTSRDPKLVARRNHKFLSHFRLIGQGGVTGRFALKTRTGYRDQSVEPVAVMR
jgi:hypothetical protein